MIGTLFYVPNSKSALRIDKYVMLCSEFHYLKLLTVCVPSVDISPDIQGIHVLCSATFCLFGSLPLERKRLHPQDACQLQCDGLAKAFLKTWLSLCQRQDENNITGSYQLKQVWPLKDWHSFLAYVLQWRTGSCFSHVRFEDHE